MEIISARVPVAKVWDMSDPPKNIGDVSVNNAAALENSRFVETFAYADSRVRPLGRLIKHWATQRQINNRSQGTLSTYTLMLQLFYLLQTREPPILPLFSYIEKAAEPFDENSGVLRETPFETDSAKVGAVLQRIHGPNDASLGELIKAFFALFGDERFGGGAASQPGHTLEVYDGSEAENELGVLVMKCPLTRRNVNPMSMSVWRSIHGEFVRAHRMLEQGQALQDVCARAEQSPLRRR